MKKNGQHYTGVEAYGNQSSEKGIESQNKQVTYADVVRNSKQVTWGEGNETKRERTKSH